ncbi:hypothetical protein PLICRDRAFT_35597 [Plicaturopsis crispa FD-325 SS-3]|nr:hypothetical protein PLICRDRAFT_35597 [Plicaturopsis crispa FD-325 SS-3]
MSFAPRPGCPMCGIVSTAAHATHNSPRSPSFPIGSTQPEVLWRDDNFTAYREKLHPVSSKGHIIIAFNLHVPSIYTLSSSDLPLLVNIRNLANRLLSGLATRPTRSSDLTSPTTPVPTTQLTHLPVDSEFHIGFITPPFKDSKIPVTDHLHAHAYIGPGDLMGWWRGIAYGPMAWYPIDDLVAEIRESVSNNRVKSGYQNRRSAPIDSVPHAGARAGTASGVEVTEPGLANPDLESGDGSPTSLRPQTPATPARSTTPLNQIPALNLRV